MAVTHACVRVCVCACVTGSRTAELSPQGSPTLGQQSSTSEDIWVLRKPLAGKLCVWITVWDDVLYVRIVLCIILKSASCVFVCWGGERSGSVGSLGSARSSSSLQGSGNTHVLTTPAPSPHPAPTTGVNTHGLNAPGLHAQAEGVKVRGFSHFTFVCMCLHLFTSCWIFRKQRACHFWETAKHFQETNTTQDTNLTTVLFPAQSVLPLERSALFFSTVSQVH